MQQDRRAGLAARRPQGRRSRSEGAVPIAGWRVGLGGTAPFFLRPPEANPKQQKANLKQGPSTNGPTAGKTSLRRLGIVIWILGLV